MYCESRLFNTDSLVRILKVVNFMVDIRIPHISLRKKWTCLYKLPILLLSQICCYEFTGDNCVRSFAIFNKLSHSFNTAGKLFIQQEDIKLADRTRAIGFYSDSIPARHNHHTTSFNFLWWYHLLSGSCFNPTLGNIFSTQILSYPQVLCS